jgi:hypothetical protein
MERKEENNNYNVIIQEIGQEYARQFKPYLDYNLRFHINSSRQFNKGLERLKYWVHLAYDDPPMLWNGKEDFIPINSLAEGLTQEEKIFVLAVLMVIFQVFGDGNHRTASEFFYREIGRSLSTGEIELLNSLARENDYNALLHMYNPEKNINNVIKRLLLSYRELRRGGKRRKTIKKKNKRRRKTNKKINIQK